MSPSPPPLGILLPNSWELWQATLHIFHEYWEFRAGALLSITTSTSPTPFCFPPLMPDLSLFNASLYNSGILRLVPSTTQFQRLIRLYSQERDKTFFSSLFKLWRLLQTLRFYSPSLASQKNTTLGIICCMMGQVSDHLGFPLRTDSNTPFAPTGGQVTDSFDYLGHPPHTHRDFPLPFCINMDSGMQPPPLLEMPKQRNISPKSLHGNSKT